MAVSKSLLLGTQNVLLTTPCQHNNEILSYHRFSSGLLKDHCVFICYNNYITQITKILVDHIFVNSSLRQILDYMLLASVDCLAKTIFFGLGFTTHCPRRQLLVVESTKGILASLLFLLLCSRH
jgi:hypothetical protein